MRMMKLAGNNNTSQCKWSYLFERLGRAGTVWFDSSSILGRPWLAVGRTFRVVQTHQLWGFKSNLDLAHCIISNNTILKHAKWFKHTNFEVSHQIWPLHIAHLKHSKHTNFEFWAWIYQEDCTSETFEWGTLNIWNIQMGQIDHIKHFQVATHDARWIRWHFPNHRWGCGPPNSGNLSWPFKLLTCLHRSVLESQQSLHFQNPKWPC